MRPQNLLWKDGRPPVSTFRIKTPTIALFLVKEGHPEAHTVPVGAIIAAEGIEGDKLIEVTWDGRKIMMFAQDIRSRAEKVLEQ